MGKFVVTAGNNGEFRFSLRADNGQVILTSEGYTSKTSCLNGVESVRKSAAIATRFIVKVTKDGRPFFNLRSGNGQIIAVSQIYSCPATMKAGIASVQKNAPGAPVVEA